MPVIAITCGKKKSNIGIILENEIGSLKNINNIKHLEVANVYRI